MISLMKIFVSDEIADSIDVNQFYENPSDRRDISLSLDIDSKILKGSISKIHLCDNKLGFGFLCSSDTASSFILSDTINLISLFNSSNDGPIAEYNNFNVESKSLKITESGEYECDLIIRSFNI